MIQQLNQKNDEVQQNFTAVGQTFVQAQEAFRTMDQRMDHVQERAEIRTQENRNDLEEEREARRKETIRRDALQEEQNETTRCLIEELRRQRKEKEELEAKTHALYQKLETQTAAHNQALIEASLAVNANRRDVDVLIQDRKKFSESRWQHFVEPEEKPRSRKNSSKMSSRMPSNASMAPRKDPTKDPGDEFDDSEDEDPYQGGGGGNGGDGNGGYFQNQDMQRRNHSQATGFHEIPKAPKYNGCTKVEMRKFMDEYQQYKREVTLLNHACGTTYVGLMPVGACIDAKAVNRICYWEIGKPYLDITEHEWVAYFSSAKDPDKRDLSKLKTAMGKLKMDTSVVNCPSRVMKLVRDFDNVLVKLSMEGFDTDEPKLAQ